MKKKALLIFAKEPVPGQVKTRLTPFLSAEAAARLYRCMLLDTLAKASALTDITPFLFYDGSPETASSFSELAVGMTVLPQSRGDLGQRMKDAFTTVFDGGYHQAVIIGTDSPDLPLAYIEEAFARLAAGHIGAVFGPSADGGYYLLALKYAYDELFEEISWSTERVLAESIAAAERAGIRAFLLPLWYDLDSADDLMRPGLLAPENGAPLTREFILGLDLASVT